MKNRAGNVMLLFCVALYSWARSEADAVELVSANRQIRASTSLGEASASPASAFGAFSDFVTADTEFYIEIAKADQLSTITSSQIDVEINTEADTDFGTFEAGSSSGSFELVFEVVEEAFFELTGRITAYDATSSVSLTGVLSQSVTTEFLNPAFPELGSPGVSDLDESGVLPPGFYTLRVLSDATPALGGLGVSDAALSLTFSSITFPAWVELHGLPEGSDPLSDDDHDGVPLIMEYAFRTDPNVADTGLAAPGFELDQDLGVAILTYPSERADLSYTVEHTSDAENWIGEGIVLSAAASAVRASYLLPEGLDQVAMRLRVELDPPVAN